jgi:hypothetical protein
LDLKADAWKMDASRRGEKTMRMTAASATLTVAKKEL